MNHPHSSVFCIILTLVLSMVFVPFNTALGRHNKQNAHVSAHRGSRNHHGSINKNANRNVNVNSNRNTNVNINNTSHRNTNVNVNVDRRHHHGGVGFGVGMFTGLVIGTAIATPPRVHTTVIVSGTSYMYAPKSTA